MELLDKLVLGPASGWQGQPVLWPDQHKYGLQIPHLAPILMRWWLLLQSLHVTASARQTLLAIGLQRRALSVLVSQSRALSAQPLPETPT